MKYAQFSEFEDKHVLESHFENIAIDPLFRVLNQSRKLDHVFFGIFEILLGKNCGFSFRNGERYRNQGASGEDQTAAVYLYLNPVPQHKFKISISTEIMDFKYSWSLSYIKTPVSLCSGQL